MFNITIDQTHKLIRARISGFFTVAEVGDFGRALLDASASLECPKGEHVLYVDTSECPLQAQDVVMAFQDLIMNAPVKARRLALITGNSLSRMQARRILDLNRTMLFDNVRDAERWLLQKDQDAQRAA